MVALAVGAACFYGPFTHVHNPGAADAHVASTHVSAGIAFHIHLGGRDDVDPSWAAAEESAHLLEWFQFEKAQDTLSAPPPGTSRFALDGETSGGWLPAPDEPAPDSSGSSPPALRGPPAIV